MDVEVMFGNALENKKRYRTAYSELEEILEKCQSGNLPNKGKLGRDLKDVYSGLDDKRITAMTEEGNKSNFADDRTGKIADLLYNNSRQDGIRQIRKDIDILKEVAPEFDFSKLETAISNERQEEVYELFGSLIECLLEKGESMRDIQEMYKAATSSIMGEMPEEIKKEMEPQESLIERLEQIMKREKVEYVAVVDVPHLSYTADELNLEDIVLVPPEGHSLQDYEEYVDGSEGNMGSVERILENDNPTLEVTVNAYGQEQAKQKLKEKLSRFWNYCSYFNVDYDVKDLPMIGAPLDYVMWSKDIERAGYISKSGDNNIKGSITEDNKKVITLMHQAASQETDLGRRFRRGMHFFRKANNSRKPIDKCIFYLASLESLIIEKRQMRSNDKIDKTLNLLPVAGEKEERVESALDNLYEARNGALHAGVGEQDIERDLSLVRYIIGNHIIAQMERSINSEEKTKLSQFMKKVQTTIHQEYNRKKDALQEKGLELDNQYTVTGRLTDDIDTSEDITAELKIRDEDKSILTLLKIVSVENQSEKILKPKEYRFEGCLEDGRAVSISDLDFDIGSLGIFLKESILPLKTSIDPSCIEVD